MKKKQKGFEVTNVANQGFKRIGGKTEIISENEFGEIPGELKRISEAQDFMQYDKAFVYCQKRADDLGYEFCEL